MRELSDLSKNGPEPFLGWVLPLVRMSKVEIAEKCGNDAVIYIHFQVLSLTLFFPRSIRPILTVSPPSLSEVHDLLYRHLFGARVGHIAASEHDCHTKR